ncbi:MAG: aldehyde dehydrogenase family protein [Acidobacteriota bacterium]
MAQATATPTTLFSEAAKERVPGAPAPLPPTPPDGTDRALEELRAASLRWIETSIAERVALLERCMESVGKVAQDWATAGCAEKGIDANASIGGQEWVGGPMPVMRNLRQYRNALLADGTPRPPALERRGERFVARVMPDGLFEKLAFGGLTAEVWIQAGREPSQGSLYAPGRPRRPGVALVLGAGNQSSIGPSDALSKLFAEDEVVLLKMNPVNEHTGPHVERAFAPLVERGFLRVVYGGAEVGQRLTPDPRIDSIHITGSARTHDAIVWGGDPAVQADRKRRRDPIFAKPITSELGSVTPCMVVPGPWKERDLDFQARHVASMVSYNAGFTCTSTQVLVLSKGWPQREAFVQKVSDALARHPPRPAYYPGASSRKQGFRDHYPAARALGAPGPAALPYLVIPPSDDDYAMREEAFCGVLACAELDGATAPDFLQSATRFCNEKLWGTLSCALLVDPETARTHGAALESAIAALRYGTIGVNVWGGVGYGIVTTPWGAYPGHTVDDVVSGIGFVHNTYFFDHPEKSVLRAPFHISPTPAWFTDHRNLREVGRLGTRFEESPGLGRFVPLALAGMKG